jgi:hypothetical protein
MCPWIGETTISPNVMLILMNVHWKELVDG